MRPRTQYVDSGGYSIAYQVIGDGPVDVLFLQGLLSHLDMQWCDPIFAAFLNRLASCSRLVVMDQRGVGLSDGAGTIPTIDERVADLAAVGSKRMFLRASASAPSCSPTLSTPHKRQPGTATSAGRNCSCATTLQCAKRSIVAAENA